MFGGRELARPRSAFAKFIEHPRDAGKTRRLPCRAVGHAIGGMDDGFKVRPANNRAIGQQPLEDRIGGSFGVLGKLRPIGAWNLKLTHISVDSLLLLHLGQSSWHAAEE